MRTKTYAANYAQFFLTRRDKNYGPQMLKIAKNYIKNTNKTLCVNLFWSCILTFSGCFSFLSTKSKLKISSCVICLSKLILYHFQFNFFYSFASTLHAQLNEMIARNQRVVFENRQLENWNVHFCSTLHKLIDIEFLTC